MNYRSWALSIYTHSSLRQRRTLLFKSSHKIDRRFVSYHIVYLSGIESWTFYGYKSGRIGSYFNGLVLIVFKNTNGTVPLLILKLISNLSIIWN
jgi:hypothetical protein